MVQTIAPAVVALIRGVRGGGASNRVSWVSWRGFGDCVDDGDWYRPRDGVQALQPDLIIPQTGDGVGGRNDGPGDSGCSDAAFVNKIGRTGSPTRGLRAAI